MTRPPSTLDGLARHVVGVGAGEEGDDAGHVPDFSGRPSRIPEIRRFHASRGAQPWSAPSSPSLCSQIAVSTAPGQTGKAGGCHGRG
jgi:hypothetical protein